MVDYYDEDKRKVIDQVSIWYSPGQDVWVTCALMVKKISVQYGEQIVLERDKRMHSNFQSALDYIESNFKGTLK